MHAAGPLLYVTPAGPVAAFGGRAKLSRLHQTLLRDLLGEDFHRFVLPDRSARPFDAVLRGHINGIDRASIAALIDAVERQHVSQLFLDGSNLGVVAHAIKRRHPRMRIVTFCHNVETRFFLGALRADPSPRALAILGANARAEQAAMRSSDAVICLSERDSRLLQRLYRRGADAIVPMVMEDVRPAETPPRPVAERYLLFVGGSFYANRDAVRWYADAIAPSLPVGTVVVGHGMNQIAPAANMTMVGAVDDIAPWYAHALAVVAPIRDGSGMKTKVAEALMFGKHVIGTAEAFSGYDRAVIAANRRCDDPASFLRAISDICSDPPPAFDPAIRLLYERFHAPAVARSALAAVLSA